MRLIDADALEEVVYDDLHYGAGIEYEEFDLVINYLDSAPTINTESLKPRGKWHKLSETKLTKTVECTHCNWSARFKKEGGIIVDSFLYCPSCGAEIKGAGENA